MPLGQLRCPSLVVLTTVGRRPLSICNHQPGLTTSGQSAEFDPRFWQPVWAWNCLNTPIGMVQVLG